MEKIQRPTPDIEHPPERMRAALRVATEALLAGLGPDGHWTGELSSSALSTATAVIALNAVDRERHARLIHGGLRWLAEHGNADGGWGDTVKSKSNISTTALCWAAFGAAGADAEFSPSVSAAAQWLATASGCGGVGLQTDWLVRAIAQRYGKDRTFSVPILMTLALSGRLGAEGWQRVVPLPFELALLPHRVYGAARLPVVSYALPALIAIGQVIHHHHATRNPLARRIRNAARHRTLEVLTTLQPENGGFLEATPLTSFVTMSLASMGLREHLVARRGAEFLCASVRADGSWAIDTDLATWTTTLAIKALAHDPQALSSEQKSTLRAWLLGQQYRVEHPYTHAAPGGWAWTNLPGGVPDADDTPGALLALKLLGAPDAATVEAARVGSRWLMDLQNRDGGIPTFCRGWGALPFDHSSPDLTAHTLRAWAAWRPVLPSEDRCRLDRASARALRYLARAQRKDGSWLPLWFGCEHVPNEANPLYGTAHVVTALGESDLLGAGHGMWPRGVRWLGAAQNDDGGWGGMCGAPSSVEETALAVEALAGTSETRAVQGGIAWLVERVESGAWREPAPIGFYFAKLWYYEKLYPLIWTVGALGRAAACR